MNKSPNVQITYLYDENQTFLCIQHNVEANQVIIRGGRNGFARLVELFNTYASITSKGKSSYEDEHWYKLVSEEHGLTIIIDNRLPKLLGDHSSFLDG